MLPGHMPALNQHQWQVYRNATGKTRALAIHRLPRFDRQSSSLTSCIRLAPSFQVVTSVPHPIIWACQQCFWEVNPPQCRIQWRQRIYRVHGLISHTLQNSVLFLIRGCLVMASGCGSCSSLLQEVKDFLSAPCLLPGITVE